MIVISSRPIQGLTVWSFFVFGIVAVAIIASLVFWMLTNSGWAYFWAVIFCISVFIIVFPLTIRPTGRTIYKVLLEEGYKMSDLLKDYDIYEVNYPYFYLTKKGEQEGEQAE